jgi:hypothetical protein
VIVVCDTNVCIHDTHLLRKKGGPALIAFLRATGGQLFIPETLHQEYLKQFVEAAIGSRNKAEAGLSALQTLMGRRLDHLLDLLPLADSIGQEAIRRLQSLEGLIRPMPLTPEIKVAATDRSLQNKRPTSKTDHGLKDCLHWESVLRLPAGSDVRLVSRDVPAFFVGEQLAPDLVVEARDLGITVTGYNVKDHKSLVPLLQDLKAAHPLLDFSTSEAFELEEPAQMGIGAVAAALLHVPAAPGREPSAESAEPGAREVQEVHLRLAEAQAAFKDLDLKILGYVSYLGTPGKEQLFRLLSQSQSGCPVDAARNVVERLVITGFVRDTGNHYLPADRRIGEIAAAAVEAEIIALLAKDNS